MNPECIGIYFQGISACLETERPQTMAQFLNAKEDIVQEAIDGIVAVSGGHLERLDGFPFIRVVKRATWDKSNVAIVSGGGSGHEPAHAGFVGEGMLTAAVCGDVFASPSVEAILAGILSVTGNAGCLLIVKNYTGDRLNFGLAAERARMFGLKINIVVVDDDIALPDNPKPRGVAGTLFIHKIAGAISEAGGTLENVTAAANRAISNVTTIGMSLDTCTVPGSVKEDRIPADKIELGLGIHGEAGAEYIPYTGAKQAIGAAVARLKPHMKSGKYAALINNLGGTTELEMAILTKELLNSEISNQLSHIIGPAVMMTALDMHGFSISLYPLNLEDELLLSEPSPLNAWPNMKAISETKVLPLPDGLSLHSFSPSSNPDTAAILTRCCDVLVAAEGDLNALDAKVGDGDTGTTLASAARALMDAMDRLPLAENPELLRAISQELSQTMGGSSGVLLAIFFAAAGDAASDDDNLLQSLKSGLERVKDVGGAQLGDRTMIDALEPALTGLEKSTQEASQLARQGAARTAGMLKAHAGRASYINAEQLKGVVEYRRRSRCSLIRGNRKINEDASSQSSQMT